MRGPGKGVADSVLKKKDRGAPRRKRDGRAVLLLTYRGQKKGKRLGLGRVNDGRGSGKKTLDVRCFTKIRRRSSSKNWMEREEKTSGVWGGSLGSKKEKKKRWRVGLSSVLSEGEGKRSVTNTLSVA